MVEIVVVKMSTGFIVMGSILDWVDPQEHGTTPYLGSMNVGKNVDVLIATTNQTFVLKIHSLVIMYVMEI